MTIRNLIEAFSDLTMLPVRATDVRDWLIKSGIQDEIIMTPIDSDPEILRGTYEQYIIHETVYASPTLISRISYSKNQCPKWQNFICIKELMHVLDKRSMKTPTPQDVLALTNGLSKIFASTELGFQDFQTIHDKMMPYAALAILLPYKSREMLLAPFAQGKISAERISDETQIPIRYISMLMGTGWDEIYASLLKL